MKTNEKQADVLDLSWAEHGEEWLKSHPELTKYTLPPFFIMYDKDTGEYVSSVDDPSRAAELFLKLFEEA